MRSILKNKKGDIFQLIFLLIILFIAAIIGILFYSLSSKVTTTYENFETIEENSTADIANKTIAVNLPYITDEFIFFMFLGMIIALIIAAVRTNYSATIIFIFILVLIMAVFIASGFVEMYQGLAQGKELSGYSENLTLTNIIFSRYTPLFICVLGGIILWIMYGKSGGDIVT